MADPLHASTQTPCEAAGGFPPFKTETFPSQIFWLTISFAVLFVIVWRIAGPRINGVITGRRTLINADIAKADAARGQAEAASGAYQTALAGARARAQSLAGETRRQLNAEIAKAKAEAEAEAARAMADAEVRIAATRDQAISHMAKSAAEAAAAIVAKLTGENPSPGDVAGVLRET